MAPLQHLWQLQIPFILSSPLPLPYLILNPCPFSSPFLLPHCSLPLSASYDYFSPLKVNFKHPHVGFSSCFISLGVLHCVPRTCKRWGWGGTQELMGVTLAVPHSIGDMEHEGATPCSLGGTLVERWRNQPIQKTFNPKFILSAKNVGTGDGAVTERLAKE